MEFFGKLMMRLFGVGKPVMDPVGKLPVEVTQTIFRMLDRRSLLNAAKVSQGWLHVCRGDPLLRATARRHLRREERRAYDLLSLRKPQATIRKTEKVVRLSQGVAVVPIFTVGPSGVSLGRIQTQNAGRSSRRNSVTRTKIESKRSILRFR